MPIKKNGEWKLTDVEYANIISRINKSIADAKQRVKKDNKDLSTMVFNKKLSEHIYMMQDRNAKMYFSDPVNAQGFIKRLGFDFVPLGKLKKTQGGDGNRFKHVVLDSPFKTDTNGVLGIEYYTSFSTATYPKNSLYVSILNLLAHNNNEGKGYSFGDTHLLLICSKKHTAIKHLEGGFATFNMKHTPTSYDIDKINNFIDDVVDKISDNRYNIRKIKDELLKITTGMYTTWPGPTSNIHMLFLEDAINDETLPEVIRKWCLLFSTPMPHEERMAIAGDDEFLVKLALEGKIMEDNIGYREVLTSDYEVDYKYKEEYIEFGIEKGFEQGIEKGLEKGFEQGIEKGIDEGRDQERSEIVKQLIRMSCDVSFISQVTKLSIDAILSIKGSIESESNTVAL